MCPDRSVTYVPGPYKRKRRVLKHREHREHREEKREKREEERIFLLEEEEEEWG